MGLDINTALHLSGLNQNIKFVPRPNTTYFGQTLNNDRFESQTPTKYTNEIVLTKLINENPKIKNILNEYNLPININYQDLTKLLATHCKDVQNISKGISENLPFSLQSKIDKKALEEASYLHDIGKVLIPAEILNKNGKLDEYETKIMHRHSELGYEILKNTNLNEKTLNLIRNHHQNAKKSGYPFVNKDFNADLDLQILTTADKYSALREKRPYKEAYTPQQALMIIYNDVKEGKIHPFVFKALNNYVNSLDTETLQRA